MISTAGGWAGISSKSANSYTIAGHALDATKPNRDAVAQFVELARLGTQHPTKMMRRLAFDDGGTTDELFDEEASAHGRFYRTTLKRNVSNPVAAVSETAGFRSHHSATTKRRLRR